MGVRTCFRIVIHCGETICLQSPKIHVHLIECYSPSSMHIGTPHWHVDIVIIWESGSDHTRDTLESEVWVLNRLVSPIIFLLFLFCLLFLQKTGSITYNGHEIDEFYVRRTSAYISQTDNHIPELTVRETLDFGARCQGAEEGFAGIPTLLC